MALDNGTPYLLIFFIICAECLTSLIKKAERAGSIHGARICRGAPIISHLLFVDDSFLFFRAKESEFLVMKDILSTYERASGQSINLQKREVLFSSNVSMDDRSFLSNILGVFQNLGSDKYLGLPSVIGRNIRATFGFIKDRIWQKISSWKSKTLSMAGREVLIITVAQAIPSYCMSIYLIPPSLGDEIQRMLNFFWWGSNNDTSKGIK